MSQSILAPLDRHRQRIISGYQGLSLRERLMVSVSILAATWMVWSLTLGGFLDSAKTRINRDVNAAYAQMQQEVAAQAQLQAEKNADPNALLRSERSSLGAELETLDEDLAAALERFVAPERMPELLKDVIRHHDGLELKRMASLPVEPIVMEVAEGSVSAESPPVIYRHPLRLEFEGNYFEVLAYLSELEDGDWKFGWRHLSYVVEDYPLAVVTLEIETLSRNRSWMGV